MAETIAQRRARVMRERMSAAKARSTAPGDDAATEKIVASPSPAVTETKQEPPVASAPAVKPPSKPRPYKRPNPPNHLGSKLTGRPGPMGGERVTYQRHVLFALVAAFIIKMVAAGKALPKA